MIEPFETIDREIEWLLHNLKGGIRDIFRVKEKTAKILMGGWLVSIDAINSFLQEDSLEIIHLSILANVMNMYFCERLLTSKWPKAKDNDSGIKVIDWKIEFCKHFRITISLFLTIFSCSEGDINTLAIYIYIISKLHDNDDRGIKNWAKWQLKKLRESIKIPGLQPSPA